jgi:hypothetical protein
MKPTTRFYTVLGFMTYRLGKRAAKRKVRRVLRLS